MAAVALLGVLTGIAVVGAGGRALDIRSAAVARSVAATRWNAPNDAAVRGGAATNPRVSRRVRVAYGRLPISFTPNAGQIASRARYLAQGAGSSLFFTDRGLVMAFAKPVAAGARRSLLAAGEAGSVGGWPTSRRLALELRFIDANRHVAVEGSQRDAGSLNFLVGDRSRWRRGLASYRKLTYRQLWPGIDLVFRGHGGALKYEFHVAAGADARNIRLAYSGVDRLVLGAHGGLQVRTGLGTLTDARPVSYQRYGHRRIAVGSRYALGGGRAGTYGFGLDARYDRTRPLVIDPGLDYSSLLGGTRADFGWGVALDRDGSAYVTGLTGSADYPTRTGALDATYNGGEVDAFVTKLTPSGSALVYSTFLGGADTDVGRAIAVDRRGSAYLAGDTFSADYPTTPDAFDSTHNGSGDAFVTKLRPSGSALAYSTFLGGAVAYDVALGVAVERGQAYVTGSTTSPDFPTTASAFDPTFNGPADVFVTKLNRSGAALAYSTLLRGGYPGGSQGWGIAVEHGRAYVTGDTAAAEFPTTPGAFDRTYSAAQDAFVTKLNRPGSALVYSTFVGGRSADESRAIALDRAHSAYITGFSAGFGYPATPDAFDPTHNGGNDAFVTKLDPSGSALVYSTFLGGVTDEAGYGIAIDHAGTAYVAGLTSSADYPTTPGSLDPSFNGGYDSFVTKLDAAGAALAYSTFVGGSGHDFARDIAIIGRGAYIVGETSSPDYPTTTGAFDPTFNGATDAFVTRVGRPRGSDLALERDGSDGT